VKQRKHETPQSYFFLMKLVAWEMGKILGN